MALHQAYLSAGSNIGDREANLRFALVSLSKENTLQKISSCYETEPVGYLDQPWFLNIAVELATDLQPLELLNLCRSIEESCGRVRSFPNAPRTLDLDILIYDAAVIRESALIIPHPRLAERRFVLEPLAQIAPDLVHPLLKKSIRLLLETCPDPSRVVKGLEIAPIHPDEKAHNP